MTNLILDFKSTLGHPAYGTIVDIMENQVQGMNVVGSLFHRLHPSLLGLVSGSSLLDALFFFFFFFTVSVCSEERKHWPLGAQMIPHKVKGA